MAPSAWVNAALRLFIEIASFLLNEPSTTCPCDTFNSVFASPELVDKPSGFIDQFFSSIASAINLPLPRSLSVFSSLPTATAGLLRLTEIVPPEILLWLVLGGLILFLWLVCLIIVGVIFGFGYATRRCTKLIRYLFRATHPLTIAATISPHTPSPPVLSDTARLLAPTVASTQTDGNFRPRRPRQRQASPPF